MKTINQAIVIVLTLPSLEPLTSLEKETSFAAFRLRQDLLIFVLFRNVAFT